MSTEKINVDSIVGLPPIAYSECDDGLPDFVKDRILSSFAVVSLYPGWPMPGMTGEQMGHTLFTLDPDEGRSRWSQIITKSGGTDTSLPLNLAFLNEGPISESWTNDYGDSEFENWLQNFSVGGKLGELRGITGEKSLPEAFKKSLKGFEEKGGLTGLASWGLSSIGGGTMSVAEGVSRAVAGDGLVRIVSGSKLDYPMLWKGTSYSANYTITVRLYNPLPLDEKAYQKFIINPLIKILAFVVPITDSDFTFNFPVLVRAECSGLFNIPAGFVSSVDVVKGGDINDVSLSQQPGIVDVRINITNLYSTMVASSDYTQHKDRPTLKNYIENMKDKAKYKYWYNGRISGGGSSNKNTNTTNSVPPSGPNYVVSSDEPTPTVSPTLTDIVNSMS